MFDEMNGWEGEVAPPITTELMHLAVAEATFRSDEVITFNDLFVNELLSTAPLRRLSRISFLGAIDLIRHGTGRSPHRRRHNRLEHSVGVARLADTYASEAELPDSRRRLLIAASLLHDVGHGPLSHTLEPVFAEYFGVDHHSETRKIVRGETRTGRDVRGALRTARLDPDEVLAMIDGHHGGPDAFLFAGPINLDTLDGISRCRAFMKPRAAPRTMLRAVREWARSGHAPLPEFDAFWALKHEVYSLLVGAVRGHLLDAAAQVYMRDNIDRFVAADFERSEAFLRKKHPQLFKYLGEIAKGGGSLKERLPTNWMTQEVFVSCRVFTIFEKCSSITPHLIEERYTQSKSTRRLSFEELIEAL